MADLIAQGEQPTQRWRRELPVGETVVLGRDAGVFTADWDGQISRRHAHMRFRNGRLRILRLDTHNPIYFQGRVVDQFEISPGEHFVIGQTSFTLAQQRVELSITAPQPVQQQAFSPQYLRELKFHNARTRIEVLARLPEVIASATSESELFVRLTAILMAGIPRSDAVALVRAVGDESVRSDDIPEDATIEVMHWDRRSFSDDDFHPSEQLIRQALSSRESVLHVWGEVAHSEFTASEEIDWAFCSPVMGSACRGWAIYVAGRFAADGVESSPSVDPKDLRDDLKFTEVAASTLRSLHELRLLQRQHAVQSQFFSPVVLDALAVEDPDVALAPRETEVTVMFCDLRGFSQESEKSADDLMGLLDRVSKALGVTTHNILLEGGVVGDFQGDAVMGFWGWPIVQDDAIERTCRAALAIRAELEYAAQQEDGALAGFNMGIGIATGRAVAGKIGTVDQVKVTVFGPVVNLASRLEGMTKILRAPILVDDRTGRLMREQIAPTIARSRRLAVVQPYGLDTAVEVSELLPPESDFPLLSNQNLADYEKALDLFQAGQWAEAFEALHQVPALDRVKDFLMVHIVQHNRTAPADWNGVIKLSSKS